MLYSVIAAEFGTAHRDAKSVRQSMIQLRRAHGGRDTQGEVDLRGGHAATSTVKKGSKHNIAAAVGVS